jgi:hypothetical protein
MGGTVGSAGTRNPSLNHAGVASEFAPTCKPQKRVAKFLFGDGRGDENRRPSATLFRLRGGAEVSDDVEEVGLGQDGVVGGGHR